MRFIDILSMSLSNLWKRKVRTVLTVLGVMIGTASIVVMLSLGLGLKSAMLDEMTGGGGMTDITVSSGEVYGDTRAKALVDDTVADFAGREHVTAVYPFLDLEPTVYIGEYSTNYCFLRGAPQEYMKNATLAKGSAYPSSSGRKLELLVGNSVPMMLQDKNGDMYWDTQVMPDVDFMKENVYLRMPSVYITGADGEEVEQPGRKFLVPVSGVVEGEPEDYSTHGDLIYVDLDVLKKFLQTEYKGRPIPNQPLNKNGQPYRELHYSSIILSVDDMDHVEDLVNTLKEEGYEASSEAEWIKQAQKEMLIIEAVLGGIGAISLLVAAIGIANTMMMSTYERTKEIGVMKVLGCSISNIRTMFLTEAAFIGLLGGVVGIVISYILSAICNIALPAVMGYDGQKISVIPLWLLLAALIFSTMVGMLAGFFPAQRATKLSPLAAIRNE